MRTRALVAATLALAACTAERPVAAPLPAPAGGLDGGPWLAEDVGGGGVPDGARVEISFDPAAGRVSGRSGCNRFTATWQQRGETATFGAVAGTRMMCPPALMDLEAKVLRVLAAPLAVAVDATGAATLTGPEGRSLRLRRAAP